MASGGRTRPQRLVIGGAFVALSIAFLIALGGGRVQRAEGATPPAPTFGQPTISGIQGVGFEQDLRLDPTNANRVYTSVPGSLSSDTSWIWRSLDAGKTFKWVPAATTKEGKPTPCAGGGDTELAVDSGANLYFNDLTLANFSTARSPDQGTTFACSNTGVPDTAVDRQWYAVDGNPTTGSGLPTDSGAGHNIYLVNDEIGPGAPVCPVSGAANNVLAMYRSSGLQAGIQFGPAKKVSAPLSCDEGIMGNDEVSPVPSVKDGSPLVKHVYVIHDDATFSRILIGRCFPVPFTTDPSGLSCRDLPVATLGTIPPGGTCPTAKTGANFPTLAIDKAGTLYAVWEQAPQDPLTCQITGDTVLKYSYSTDEGDHWSTPVTIPTPGLHNNVFAWAAAGDNGRVDVAWYGTPATANPNDPTCGTNHGGHGGPDAVTNGIWSLYVTQTTNGNSSAPAFTSPVLASEHYTHKGSIQTVLGGQCGDRTLGDFLQLRIGSHGEAQISYADSNNTDESFAPHGMYVKQNGGTGAFANTTVGGDPILLNAASDPARDAQRETNSVVGPTNANLDILHSSMAQPSPASCHPTGTPCYRVRMTINNLTMTPPYAQTDPYAVWLTQWLVPADPNCSNSSNPTVANSDACKKGGKNYFVYLQSDGTCWSGENAAAPVGGGVALTYPGAKQIVAPGACSFSQGLFGQISIDVPIADVSDPALVLSRLYSVTASTMTLAGPANVPPGANGTCSTTTTPACVTVFSGRLGGQLFDLIDVVRAYDFVPGAEGGGGGGGDCHEGDGDGHIQGEQSGQASFHVDADDCEDHDGQHVDMSDPGSGHDFHSTDIFSVGFDDVAHSMTIVGMGTDNGLPVTFTAVEVDKLTPLASVFQITLSDGYSNSGTLTDGTITLH